MGPRQPSLRAVVTNAACRAITLQVPACYDRPTMPAKITIVLDAAALRALARGSPVRALLGGGRPAARGAREGRKRRAGVRGKRTAMAPREGSLPARLVAWARSFGKSFDTDQVRKALKVTRAHASMLLARVVRDGPVRREKRGVYTATGAGGD